MSPGDLDTTIAAILENLKTEMSSTYMAMLSTKNWFYFRFQEAPETAVYAHVVTSVIVIQITKAWSLLSWYTEPIRSYAIIIMTTTSVTQQCALKWILLYSSWIKYGYSKFQNHQSTVKITGSQDGIDSKLVVTPSIFWVLQCYKNWNIGQFIWYRFSKSTTLWFHLRL